jgi:hypothetical protein
MILKCISMKWDESMDWIDLAQDKDKWGGCGNELPCSKNCGEFLDLAREY